MQHSNCRPLITLSRTRLIACLSLAMLTSVDAGSHPRHSSNALKETQPSTNCESDLRDAVANAVEGATINISLFGCSSITLASGAITVIVDNLTLSGAGADALVIDGNASAFHYNRIFDHTGVGTLTITGMTLTGAHLIGSTALGGCIYSMGSVELRDAVVTGCEVEAPASSPEAALGGGVYAREGLHLMNSMLSGNVARSANNDAIGGGAFSHGAFTAKYSSIGGNTTVSPMGYAIGGGIAVWGDRDLSVASSVIYGNVAELSGGLSARTTGKVLVTNSTISDNVANYVPGASFDHDVTIESSTVTGNHAAVGNQPAGIEALGTLSAGNSIFADNRGPADAVAVDLGATIFVATSANVVMHALNALPVSTLRNCPRLTSLADHGGTTLTRKPVAGSLNIDAGSDANFQTDQRGAGFPRIYGQAIDIGAVEWEGEFDDAIFRSAFEPTCDSYD